MRKDRSFNQMREISFEKNVNIHADGSCLVKFGNTHVLCLATIDEKVPHWLKNTGKGWVTAEYGMLPRSTNTRMDREAAKGKQSGRTQEIQRLIGRSDWMNSVFLHSVSVWIAIVLFISSITKSTCMSRNSFSNTTSIS